MYKAIYTPEGKEPPPKSIINSPKLQVYVRDFGKLKHDRALVADINGNIVGAVWVRIMHDYGHIDNETPSLAMAVDKNYRGLGIGTALLKEMLVNLKLRGYSKVSLSVQKANYAVRMYQKAGFKIFDKSEEEYIMVALL